MDEKEFFTKMDAMHEEVIEGLASIMEEIKELKNMVNIKMAVKTTLADFSNKSVDHSSSKPMPERLGNWTIGKKPCQKCGGKISWDNYSKDGQNYPDHIDEHGVRMPGGCPEYKKQ
jgi:hypothetical protein